MSLISIIDIYFLIIISLTLLYTYSLHYLRNGLKKIGCKRTKQLPSVSIIVSMHNEESNAAACLDRLVTQKYPKSKLEIIIVNDRSDDQTTEIIEKYCEKYNLVKSISIQHLQKDFAPKKYAIDRAVRLANGDIILLTDADGRPLRSWVQKMVSCFNENVGMVIGYAPYLTDFPYKSLLFRFLALEYLSHAAIAAATVGLEYPVTCVGTNMAYRREVFLQLNGFGNYKDLHTGDDDLFLQRVREETNWKIKYIHEKSSQVYNAPPSSWQKFYQQRIRYASKGFIYPRRISKILLTFYIFNLLLLLAPIAFISDPLYIIPLLGSLLLKALSEYRFLDKAATILYDRRYLYLFPVVFLLHIPYVLLFGLMGQFKRFEWGGHKS